MKGEKVEFSDNQVNGLLAGTRLVLEALRLDLLEHESFAVETIAYLAAALAALPEDMGAVRNIDQTRAIGDKLLEGGFGSGRRGA